MIKLIVADMDGTSLNNKEKISKTNTETILKILDTEKEFIFASGRPVYGMKCKIKEAGLEKYIKYFIAYNGGIVYDAVNNKNIYVKNMDFDIIKKIYNIVTDSNSDVCFCLHEDDIIYISHENKEIDEEVKSNNQKKVHIVNIDDLSKKQFMKILLVGKKNNLQKIADILNKTELNNYIKTMFSLDMLLEVLPFDSDKSVALKWFTDYINIPLSDVLAIGDAENDIEMLKESGTSVAMSNAYEHVKEFVDYVTKKSNNEDGLTEAIKKYVKL